MMRNPQMNPVEGDVLKYDTVNGYRELIIDGIREFGSMIEIAYRIVDGNGGSGKVLERNGFKEYGRIPSDHYLEGKYHDSVRFYKLQEW